MTFEFKSEKRVLILFNALERPHLESGIQFWSAYYREDINKLLERIERKATKMTVKQAK